MSGSGYFDPDTGKEVNKALGVKTPTIFNKTITNSNTEYSQALPARTKKVLIKVRSGTKTLKLAYVNGESGSKYITIPVGSSKYLEGAYLSGLTLYFQCPSAGQVAEIEVWT